MDGPWAVYGQPRTIHGLSIGWCAWTVRGTSLDSSWRIREAFVRVVSNGVTMAIHLKGNKRKDTPLIPCIRRLGYRALGLRDISLTMPALQILGKPTP